jgi:hypothetical protein
MTQTATAVQQEDGVDVNGRGGAPGRVEVAERAAEAAGAADGAFGLNPFLGFTGADICATIQQIAQLAPVVAQFLAEEPRPEPSRLHTNGSPGRLWWIVVLIWQNLTHRLKRLQQRRTR